MNLLVRSLSPSGQPSSSGSTGSPSGNRSSRGNTFSPAKSFFRQRSSTNTGSSPKHRLGHSRSYAGDRDYHPSVQPHILFDLDADPPRISHNNLISSSTVPSSPTSVSTASTVTPSTKPSWLRLRKPLSTGRFTSDRFSSPPTPSDFDYYEYFSNYARSPSDPGDVVQSKLISQQSSQLHPLQQQRDIAPIAPIRLNRSSHGTDESATHYITDQETSRPVIQSSDSTLDPRYSGSSGRHFSPLRRRDLYTETTRKSGMVADTLTSSGGGAAVREEAAAAAAAAVSTGDLYSRCKLHSKVDASTSGPSVHYPPVTSYSSYYSVSPPSISPSSQISANQYFEETSGLHHPQHQLMLHPSIHSIDHHNRYTSSSGVDYIDHSLYVSDVPANHQVHLSDTPPVTRRHLYSPGHLEANHVRSRPSSATGYYQFMDPAGETHVSYDYPLRSMAMHAREHVQQQQHLMRHVHPSVYPMSSGYLNNGIDYQQIHSTPFHHVPGHSDVSVNHPSQMRQQASKYTCTTVAGNGNGNTSCQCFRISFIETTAYIAQDIPGSCTSPEHLPPNHRFNKHIHSEW